MTYFISSFFVFVLYFTDLLLLLVCWGTLESKVGNNKMAAVDEPRTYSALLSRPVAANPIRAFRPKTWSSPEKLPLSFVSKESALGGLHNINSSFLNWCAVPCGAPLPEGSVAVFRPVFLCKTSISVYFRGETLSTWRKAEA